MDHGSTSYLVSQPDLFLPYQAYQHPQPAYPADLAPLADLSTYSPSTYCASLAGSPPTYSSSISCSPPNQPCSFAITSPPPGPCSYIATSSPRPSYHGGSPTGPTCAFPSANSVADISLSSSPELQPGACAFSGNFSLSPFSYPQEMPQVPFINPVHPSLPVSSYQPESAPFLPGQVSPLQMTPPTELEQTQLMYAEDAVLHKNSLAAQFLVSNNQFAQFFEFVTTSQFRRQDHAGVQQLWQHCLYTQHAASKTTPLTAVDRHRLRKRFPFPGSIWNGESTSYNRKQSARRALAQAFELDQYPGNDHKKQLAEMCEMDYLQVCNWFKNRRMREKRLQKEEARRRERGNQADSGVSSHAGSLGGSGVSSALGELGRLQDLSM